MSKFADQLRELKIFNNHGLLTAFGGVVCVDYNPGSTGRMGVGDVPRSTAWSTQSRRPLQTEWVGDYASHSKEFIGKRAKTFQKAVEWAEKVFKCKLVVSPFGGRVPERTIKRARAAVASLKDQTVTG